MGSMSIDSNFEDLLSLFTARGVRFLVVGGYAFGSHATPRATKDLLVPSAIPRLSRDRFGFVPNAGNRLIYFWGTESVLSAAASFP